MTTTKTRTTKSVKSAPQQLEFRLQFTESAGDYAAGEFLPRVYLSKHAAMVAQKLWNDQYEPSVQAVICTVTTTEVVREADTE